MKYNSPKEIGVGDVVTMKDDTGYITEHLVITNYIKGETDAKGFTPKSNFTILKYGFFFDLLPLISISAFEFLNCLIALLISSIFLNGDVTSRSTIIFFKIISLIL